MFIGAKTKGGGGGQMILFICSEFICFKCVPG